MPRQKSGCPLIPSLPGPQLGAPATAIDVPVGYPSKSSDQMKQASGSSQGLVTIRMAGVHGISPSNHTSSPLPDRPSVVCSPPIVTWIGLSLESIGQKYITPFDSRFNVWAVIWGDSCSTIRCKSRPNPSPRNPRWGIEKKNHSPLVGKYPRKLGLVIMSKPIFRVDDGFRHLVVRRLSKEIIGVQLSPNVVSAQFCRLPTRVHVNGVLRVGRARKRFGIGKDGIKDLIRGMNNRALFVRHLNLKAYVELGVEGT